MPKEIGYGTEIMALTAFAPCKMSEDHSCSRFCDRYYFVHLNEALMLKTFPITIQAHQP